MWCEFPGAATAKHHKPAGLEQQEVVLSQSGGWSGIQVSQGRASSGGSRGGSFLLLATSGGPGVPGLVTRSLKSLPLSSRGVLHCMCVSEFPLLISHWIQGHPLHCGLIFLHLQSPYFKIRSRSQALGFRP